MARTEFKTFQEAVTFSKNLSMTTKASTSVKRERGIWFVEDQRGVQENTSSKIISDKAPTPNIQSTQYDIFGFNKEGIHKSTGTRFSQIGFDRDGYNKEGFKKVGYTFIHKDTGTIFNLEGYDAWDRHKDEREKYRTLTPSKNGTREDLYDNGPQPYGGVYSTTDGQ